MRYLHNIIDQEYRRLSRLLQSGGNNPGGFISSFFNSRPYWTSTMHKIISWVFVFYIKKQKNCIKKKKQKETKSDPCLFNA